MTQNKTTKGLVAVVLTAFLAGTSHAFTSVSKNPPLIASATIPASAGQIAMSAVIKKVIDNTVDTQIAWSNITLPATFKAADDYIQLDSTITLSNGGIQIYTDNVNATGVSKFTGPINGTSPTPAGLVNNSDGTKKLPTGWTILAANGAAPVAGDPNVNRSWFYHEDASQVAVASLNAGAFTPGEDNITVENVNGIHFAQGNGAVGGVNDANYGGGSHSPNYIYTEADFSTAAAPNTYSTTRLILEAYTF
jgi:hypothetical protein